MAVLLGRGRRMLQSSLWNSWLQERFGWAQNLKCIMNMYWHQTSSISCTLKFHRSSKIFRRYCFFVFFWLLGYFLHCWGVRRTYYSKWGFVYVFVFVFFVLCFFGYSLHCWGVRRTDYSGEDFFSYLYLYLYFHLYSWLFSCCLVVFICIFTCIFDCFLVGLLIALLG